MIRLRRADGNVVFYDNAVAAIFDQTSVAKFVGHRGEVIANVTLSPGDDIFECGSPAELAAAEEAYLVSPHP